MFSGNGCCGNGLLYKFASELRRDHHAVHRGKLSQRDITKLVAFVRCRTSSAADVLTDVSLVSQYFTDAVHVQGANFAVNDCSLVLGSAAAICFPSSENEANGSHSAKATEQ